MASLASLAASAVLVSLIGAGAGFGAAAFLAPEPPPPPPAQVTKEAAALPAATPHLTPLPPILTNLAHPRETWARVELSLLSDESLPAGDPERVAQDLLAYLRTVRLDQMEGPSGFLTLREELSSRAALRTQGRARRVLVRTLVFE